MKTKATQATKTFATDLVEMMAAWDRIRTDALLRFPGATEDEIQQIASGAMENAIGMTQIGMNRRAS